VSPSLGEDLRAFPRKGLRDTLVWLPLPTAIAWILFQASALLITLALAVISSWPITHPEIALYAALPAAVLIAVAWGLGRRKRWAWVLGMTLEIGATQAFGLRLRSSRLNADGALPS